MPIYEYRCSKCDMMFEHLAKNSADQASKCPKCGAPRPVKQFSTFNAGASGGHDHGGEACDSDSCGSCAAADSCPYDE